MKKGIRFDFNKMLLLFAIIPVFCTVLILCITLIGTSSKEVKQSTNNSMLSLIKDTGIGVDNYFAIGEETLKSFTTSPVVIDLLKNPDDTDTLAKAQQYTTDYFNSLNGWEGIYIADWNSKVLTHPAPPVVGKVMREGDRLKELQDAMLASDGVYNVGIITSPASGELIVSMYAPIYDGDKPIGYVGAGTFISDTASMYSDVSELKLDSAYTYFVDKEGTMLAHPNEEKIGQPVENEVVKGLIEKMQNGEHPEPACISYKYKGAQKYAAYYVGVNENYIAVLTADESDVLKNVNKIRTVVICISIIIMIVCIILALFFARLVAKPLDQVAKAMKETADGNLNANTNIRSITSETQLLVESAKTLQTVLQDIIGKTKHISDGLTSGAEKVTSLSDKGLESTSQITSAIEELADGAFSMAESVQNIREKLVTMGDAIDEISGNTAELSDSSNKIKIANADASAYISRVSDSSEQSVDAVHDITKQITETNEAIERIKNASNMIRDIASQTSLLALNASIEAARAGEAGRGFAVVATEIQILSEQSNQSVEEINKIVDEIVEKSENSVRLSSEVANIITREKEYILETQNKFDALNTQIETSLEEISNITVKVDMLNDSKDMILDEVADLSAISEENAASNQEVSASVHEISAAVEDIATNASETKNDASQLKETIDYFE